MAGGRTGLHILAVTDPAAPHEVGSCETSGFTSGVRVAGTYALVADGEQRLQFIDVSKVAAPFEVSFIYTITEKGFAERLLCPLSCHFPQETSAFPPHLPSLA